MSVKLRISQNPNTANTFCPGIKGSILPPPVEFATFCAIILLPASPSPIANKAAVLTIVCSRTAVSSFSSFFLYKAYSNKNSLPSNKNFYLILFPPFQFFSRQLLHFLLLSQLLMDFLLFFALLSSFVQLVQ